MEEGPAGIDHVGYVAVLLIVSWAEERLAQSADDPSWVFEVEQDAPDVVGPHGTDAVGEHQPARLGLDWRPAVAELNDLP